MPKIIAKFSNGHEDKYNGKRDVKAAWMITGPEGDFSTGHSQDLITARKTAEKHAYYRKGAPEHFPKPSKYAHSLNYQDNWARKMGFRNAKEAYADYQAKMAIFRARCTIEIVEL